MLEGCRDSKKKKNTPSIAHLCVPFYHRAEAFTNNVLLLLVVRGSFINARRKESLFVTYHSRVIPLQAAEA